MSDCLLQCAWLGENVPGLVRLLHRLAVLQ